MFPAILMAVSMAREKEIGTITNFYVTPTKRLEFLIGKQLPYIGIGLVNFVILTLLVVFLLQVPLKGSLLALILGAFFVRVRIDRLWAADILGHQIAGLSTITQIDGAVITLFDVSVSRSL
jgi:ABC-type Na+ efflux pump permease subunit